jgi:hypothetical protein
MMDAFGFADFGFRIWGQMMSAVTGGWMAERNKSEIRNPKSEI